MDHLNHVNLVWLWLALNVLPALPITGRAIYQRWQHGRRRQIRHAIHQLEHFANHPGARRLLDDIHNQPREEKP